jgi:integrase
MSASGGIEMLTIFRRHARNCAHKSKGRSWKTCKCPIHCEGVLGNDYIRESLDTRNWEVAQTKVRNRETATLIPAKEEQPQITVEDAIQKFLGDARARHLSNATLAKQRVLTEQLQAFAKLKGFSRIEQFTSDVVREFRSSWKDAPISALKKFERLRSFFRFCQRSGWIAANPVEALQPPKVRQKPTLPFTGEQMEKILWASDLFSTNGRYRALNRTRIRAMTMLLRYSGLRIGDAVTLRRDRITDGRLFLYTQKTGVAVHLPLPQVLLDELKKLGETGERFFWNGQGKVTSAIGVWERTFKRLFAIAGIEGGHPHRFRDTFAVELLQKGVPLEKVSVLLGHSSIRITERHYAPWVESRQAQLEEMVRRTW